MKVCPVCNETFPEELKFCDLDGAKLHRDGASTAQAQGKLWSLLGVGVVLGSLVIIALAILFSPTTPAPVSSFTPVTPSSESKPVMADATSSYQPEVVEEDTPVAELKKKEKSLDSANSNTNSSLANPKTAAQTEEDKAAQPATAEIKEPAQPEPKKVESTSPNTVKAAAESSESSKTSAAKAETKKETKSSKDADKDSADKKQADSKDKKKGGFLNVFRKIFGGKKDDKDKKNK